MGRERIQNNGGHYTGSREAEDQARKLRQVRVVIEPEKVKVEQAQRRLLALDRRQRRRNSQGR